jgi:hypothetical protein
MGGVVETVGSETRGLCGITAVGTTKEEVAPPTARPVVRQEAAAAQVVFIHFFIIKNGQYNEIFCVWFFLLHGSTPYKPGVIHC